MALKTIWTKNPAEKQPMEHALREAPIIVRLKQIILDRLTELETREINVDNYKDNSWSHIQAHINGRKQELYYTLNLLDLGDS